MITTEGEEFIEEYLRSQKIKFRKQQPIDGLINDTKSHRIADFYLPKYKVYIEYFGQWNLDQHKERYKEKKQVYINNNIPCVILYPENLGVIEFVFPKRMFYVMNRYKLENELKKYKWKAILDNRGSSLILILIALFLIGYSFPWKDRMWLYVLMIFISYQSFIFRREYKLVFDKEKVYKNYFED